MTIAHSSAKPMQMKLSITFIQNNGWKEMDLILKHIAAVYMRRCQVWIMIHAWRSHVEHCRQLPHCSVWIKVKSNSQHHPKYVEDIDPNVGGSNLLCATIFLQKNFACLHHTALQLKRKRRRSDSVLWQKPLYQQKIRKPMYNTKTPPKTSITQRLRTN